MKQAILKYQSLEALHKKKSVTIIISKIGQNYIIENEDHKSFYLLRASEVSV